MQLWKRVFAEKPVAANKGIEILKLKLKLKAQALELKENLAGVETGDFGIIYRQFKGEPKKAIKHLMKVKQGECIAALHRDDVGDIDIVWGENDKNNKGYGLKHIIEKHGAEIKQLGFEVEDFIPIVVQFGNFNEKASEKGRKVYESNMFRFIVESKYKGSNKNWLLTAFDLRKKPLEISGG